MGQLTVKHGSSIGPALGWALSPACHLELDTCHLAGRESPLAGLPSENHEPQTREHAFTKFLHTRMRVNDLERLHTAENSIRKRWA